MLDGWWAEPRVSNRLEFLLAEKNEQVCWKQD